MKKLGIFPVALLLTACGGGGGSSELNSRPSQPPVTTPSQRISLTAVSYNACNVESPLAGVDAVLQDSAGQVVAHYQTDSQGHIDGAWPTSAKHLTVVNTYNGLRAFTTLDANAGDQGTIRFSSGSREGCSCHYITVDVSAFASSNYGAKLLLGSSSYTLSGQSTVSFNSCSRSASLNALPLDIQLIDTDGTAKAGKLDLNASAEQFVLNQDDFTAPGVEVAGSQYFNADEVTARGALDDAHSGWSNSAEMGFTAALIYPALSQNNLVNLSSSEQVPADGIIAKGSASTWAKVAVDGSVNELRVPELGQAFWGSILAVLQDMEGDPPYFYDFSTEAQGVTTFSTTIDGVDANGDYSYWQISGPAKGEIPDLYLPTTLENQFEQLEVQELEFSVIAYGDGISWADWQNKQHSGNTADLENYRLQHASFTFTNSVTAGKLSQSLRQPQVMWFGRGKTK